jgi:hypothetical protein
MPVPDIEICLLVLTYSGLLLGTWGILWVRAGASPLLVICGRGIFLCTLVLMGVTCLVAASFRADGLIYLGLSAGFLVILMLWESPRDALHTPKVQA